MEHRFRLHPHEVWREGLVREGVYGQSADFADVLPEGVWNESRFVFGRYSPRGKEDGAIGHILFRPENGDENENFFVAAPLQRGLSNVKGNPACSIAEFVFGSERADPRDLRHALQANSWGRVFYFDEEENLSQASSRASSWALFLVASGYGVWKWTIKTGVTWGTTSAEGAFHWPPSGAEHGRFLASASSENLGVYLQTLLHNPESEIAFARRWLRTPDMEERAEMFSTWTNGSRKEAHQVLRALLIQETDRLDVSDISADWCVLEMDQDMIWSDNGHIFSEADFKRLRTVFKNLRAYFKVQPTKKRRPLCVTNSGIGWSISEHITEPTAHERLEAQLQLTQWAQERGLSFD